MNLGTWRERVFALLAVSLAACGAAPAAGLTITPAPASLPPLADLRADVNRDGLVDAAATSDDINEDTWDDKHGAIFLANIDADDPSRCPYTSAASDDSLAACNDASDDVLNGPGDLDDLAPLLVMPWSNAPDSAVGTLTLSAPQSVRLFRKVGASYLVFNPANDTLSAQELRDGVELRVEGKDIVRNSATWDGFVDVILKVTVPAGSAPFEGDSTDTIRMRVAPLILFHHLLNPVTAYVTRVPAGQYGTALSTTFVNSLKGIFTAQNLTTPLVEVATPDLWNQDYFETGFMTMPAANGTPHVIRVNIRSANVEAPSSTTKPLRPAGRVVFQFRGPDVGAIQQYDRSTPGGMQSLNSFGNTETIPPYTLGSESYPLGRIIRGSIPSFYTDKSFTRMLESQQVQKPLYIDTSWLLVGHVDETISFIKAPTPRGWKLVVNDPRLAVQMLQNMVSTGQGATKMFVGLVWPDLVNNTNKTFPAAISAQDVLNDTEVMSESTASAAEVDAQVAIIKTATGLTDAEIVKVPYLHFTVDGASLAYQPGTVNGLYAKENTFISPAPHGPVVGGKDIFADQLETALAPEGVTVKWLDDWDLYHTNMGEVHCATNTAREIPNVKWWETGR